MLNNYIKIAFRNFIKNKSFSSLSVLSLCIAVTCVLMIGLYAKKEFSYDRFHSNADNIYRLTVKSVNQNTERTVGFVPLPLSAHLTENFAEVTNFARVWEYRRSMPVSVPDQNKVFYEDNFAWAEESFFSIFDFEIVAGDKENPLNDFRSVVISESTAAKYFGDENPIGQAIYFQGETDIPLYVSAVMKDFPENSHFHFDFIGNNKTAAEDFWAGGRVGQEFFDRWVNLFVPAYILVEPGTDLEPVLAEATKQVNNYFEVPGSVYTVNAQPITDIHLTSNLDVGEWKVNGSAGNVFIVLIIGGIVLLLGCFNFVNLVTAQAAQRVKEVGLRKTLGSNRQQLMVQFYFESFILVIVAVFLAFGITELLQPALSGFVGENSPFGLFASIKSASLILGFLFLVVLTSGAYPALYISKFSASSVLKGTFSGQSGEGSLRKILVTTQFALSGALIICTMIISQQLEHMQQTDLGFEEDQIVVIPIHRDNAIIPNFDRLKEAYQQNSNVKSVTTSSHLMLASYTYSDTFSLVGSDQDYRWERYTVEADYPQTYGLNFIAGRSFRKDAAVDTNAVILNETALAELGMTPDDVIGRRIQDRSMGIEGQVVGVVEDFHYQSLHEAIQPFVLIHQPDNVDFISVKINTADVGTTIRFLEDTWNRVLTSASFGYYFLDSTFGQVYEREDRLNLAVFWFSGVAIFLACLGLFGLSLFTAERRTKEIGVRKVLGASVMDIVVLITSGFTKLIAIALVIAVPVVYLLMNNWLNDFAYRIDMSVWVFLIGVISVLGISWLTVSYHSVKAATTNPVDSLKSE